MEKRDLPQQFSPFSWALAGFCLPILLWPLALLISPNLLKNPQLTDAESTWFSIYLWVYPFLLGIFARIAYRLHQRKPKLAKRFLSASALIFWLLTLYLCWKGFN